jgi:hypothetical protein
MYFEYEDNNDIVKDISGTIIFSNYIDADNKYPLFPVPFNRNTQNRFKPENTIDLGMDMNLYEIEYYHNGYIISITNANG